MTENTPDNSVYNDGGIDMGKSAKQIRNENEKRVGRIYSSRCHGIQVNIMDTTKIMKVGMDSIRNGDDDRTLGDKIETFVRSISAN